MKYNAVAILVIARSVFLRHSNQGFVFVFDLLYSNQI